MDLDVILNISRKSLLLVTGKSTLIPCYNAFDIRGVPKHFLIVRKIALKFVKVVIFTKSFPPYIGHLHDFILFCFSKKIMYFFYSEKFYYAFAYR